MAGLGSMKQTLLSLRSIQLCEKSAAAMFTRKFRVEKFSLAEFGATEKKPSFEFFKALVDSGHPPIVQVDSDKRNENSNWLEIESGGRSAHVLNVVGYDEVLDPLTLCFSKVFIVRDSLGKKTIEYRVSATNLIEHLQGVRHDHFR